jgi:hypothetical protein
VSLNSFFDFGYVFTLSSFLNDIERIASRNYEPSDDDVIRARLRTLGVQEYKIQITPDNASQSILLGTSISSVFFYTLFQ